MGHGSTTTPGPHLPHSIHSAPQLPRHPGPQSAFVPSAMTSAPAPWADLPPLTHPHLSEIPLFPLSNIAINLAEILRVNLNFTRALKAADAGLLVCVQYVLVVGLFGLS